MFKGLREMLRNGKSSPGRANFEWSLARCDELFAHRLCWVEVRDGVLKIVANRNLDDVPDFAEGARRPQSLSRVLSIILSIVIERIGSGELSVHRGILSGWGQDYLGLGKDVINNMVASGATPISELREELAALDAIASEAG